MPADREAMQKIRDALWTERSSFDSHWRELSDFLLPRRSRFWSGDRNKGDKRNQNIIDSSPRFAARTLQSGLHAGLTSPARPWFRLTTPDPDLAEHGNVKVWLHLVTQRMQSVFQRTNLYQSLSTLYGDLSVFGTATLSVLQDPRDLFRCYTYPVGSFAIGMDSRGLVTSFVRDYELTVRQVVEQFVWRGPGYPKTDLDWTTVSNTVKTLWEQRSYESPIEVCWIVTPNDDADTRNLLAKHKPWVSVHFEKGASEQKLLRVSGFDSFPVMAPRWDVTGEDSYGTDCPGMTALGDVKALQIMQREKAKAVKKIIDPPLKGLPELRTQKTSLLPGDITYVREPQHGLSPIHEVSLNLSDLTLDIRETQYRIRRAFYEDLFLMLSAQNQTGAPITATEVTERHEEKLLALGPVLERTSDELLSPLIDRVYLLMEQAGFIPPAPDELQGVALKVEYTSILAEAQKLVGVVGQDRFMGSMGQMMTVFPDIADKIDTDRVVDDYAEMLGIDPRIVRPTEAAQAIRGQRQQAQASAMQAQQAAILAKAANQAGNTPMGKDSLLDRVVGGAASPSVSATA